MESHIHSLGLVYAQMGEYEKAIRELKNDYEVNRFRWDYYYLLGICYYQTGNLHQAVFNFQKAKELKGKRTKKIDRELFKACISIARDYYEKGMLDSSGYYYNLGISSYRKYLKEIKWFN